MKKMISLLLVMLMSVSMLALAGCSGNENNGGGSNTEPDAPAIESAQAFYTDVWAKFAEDD